MRRHIENLRQKPEHVRKRIAVFTSLGVTAVILLFWIASFSASTGSSAKTIETSKVLSPAANLKASALDALGSIKDIFSNFGASSYSASDSIEVVPKGE